MGCPWRNNGPSSPSSLHICFINKVTKHSKTSKQGLKGKDTQEGGQLKSHSRICQQEKFLKCVNKHWKICSHSIIETQVRRFHLSCHLKTIAGWTTWYSNLAKAYTAFDPTPSSYCTPDCTLHIEGFKGNEEEESIKQSICHHKIGVYNFEILL